MLILPLKPAVKYDLGTALSIWLDDGTMQISFQPTNPLQFVVPKPEFSSTSCHDDMKRLQSLRNCLTDVFQKTFSHRHANKENAMNDVEEYHAVLLEFERRGFPSSVDDECNGIRISWKGAFDDTKLEKHGTLVWDRSCVLYNAVALLTDKIANDCGSVNSRDDCKVAVGLCQRAASICHILSELVQSQNFATVDLSQPMLIFWEKFLLAHGQNFVYRMMSAGGDNDTKHSTLALLAQSAHLLYNEALKAAQDARLTSEVPRESEEWGGYCKANSMMHAGRATFHRSVARRLAAEWGMEIYELRRCLSQLERCRDFLKTLDADGCTEFTRRECNAILPVVADRLREADNDNYKIYQDIVPPENNNDDSEEKSKPPAKQMVKLNPNLPESMLVPKRPLFVGL